jgi:DNA repair protein RadC
VEHLGLIIKDTKQGHANPSPSEADLRLTRRILDASKILQLQLIDHVIIGSPAPGRSRYFSFEEGGVIG